MQIFFLPSQWACVIYAGEFGQLMSVYTAYKKTSTSTEHARSA